MSGENPPGAAGLVLVLHGGRSASTDPVTRTQLTVLRMIPLSRDIRRAVEPLGGAVRTPLFTVRGWNGASAAPVADLLGWLDDAPRGSRWCWSGTRWAPARHCAQPGTAG